MKEDFYVTGIRKVEPNKGKRHIVSRRFSAIECAEFVRDYADAFDDMKIIEWSTGKEVSVEEVMQ